MIQVKRQNSCTTVNENIAYAKLPPLTKGYIQEKVEYALKNTFIKNITKKTGQQITVVLCQVRLSAAIAADEINANYKWQYRPEVVFDMKNNTRLIEKVSDNIPIPYLSSSSKDPNRRRSNNPFRRGSRRPDIIIAKNPNILWCGRAANDHDGHAHADNLLRVVEVKFPKDVLNAGQRNAYLRIAGDMKRFTVIDVTDCDDDIEKAKQAFDAKNAAPVPIRSSKKIPEKVFYEQWLTHAQDTLSSLQQSAEQLSAQIKSYLHQHAPWLFQAGNWIQEKGSSSWHYINKQGQKISTWTQAQLQAALQQIQHYTDLTLDSIKQIDWYQVAIDAGKAIGVVIIAIAIGALVFCVSIPASVVAAFTAVVGIFTVSATA